MKKYPFTKMKKTWNTIHVCTWAVNYTFNLLLAHCKQYPISRKLWKKLGNQSAQR